MYDTVLTLADFLRNEHYSAITKYFVLLYLDILIRSENETEKQEIWEHISLEEPP